MRLSAILFRWLAIIWTLIILIGCLTPHEDVPDELLIWSDKLLHILLFAPFALLWMVAGFRMSYVLLAGLLFGTSIEVLQSVLPINRSGDWQDILADGMGTIIGLGVAWIVQRYNLLKSFQ